MPIALEENCTCPHCGETFQLAQALAQEAIERLQANFAAEGNAEVQEQVNAARAQGAAEAQEAAQQQLADAQEEVARAQQAAQVAAQAAVQENAVQQQQQIEQLQAQVIQMQTNAAAHQAAQEQQIANAVAQAEQQFQAQNIMELQQRDNQIRQLTANLANLNAQAQQGHGQAAGEVGEVAVENILRQTFPQDEVQPVPAGHHGADLILSVREMGMVAGKIIIEVKNTQNWSNQWIPTLLENQAAANAEIAVLVTNKLPAGMTHGGLRENVYVCRLSEFQYLIQALRQSVAAVAQARNLAENADTNAHRLYNFVLSTRFQHAMNSLVTPIFQMREHHEREKRALQRSWNRRENEIERALNNATAVLGSFAANMPGEQLPAIDGLPELEDLPDDDEDENDEE